MSKIVKKTGYRELSHVVQTDDGRYFMVFSWDDQNNEVDDWRDLYCEIHGSEDDMARHHKSICDNLELILYESEGVS